MPPPDNTTRPVAPATGHRPICMLLRGRSILRHRARPPPRIEHFRRRRARFWQYRRRKSRPPTINWRNPSFPPPFSPPFSSFPPPIYSSPGGATNLCGDSILSNQFYTGIQSCRIIVIPVFNPVQAIQTGHIPVQVWTCFLESGPHAVFTTHAEAATDEAPDGFRRLRWITRAFEVLSLSAIEFVTLNTSD